MKNILETLFPARADNNLRGSKWPLYLFILVAAIGLVRASANATRLVSTVIQRLPHCSAT